jgi:hypothetical protein
MELFGWGMNSMLVCLTALGLVQLQSSWNSAILSSIFGYPRYKISAGSWPLIDTYLLERNTYKSGYAISYICFNLLISGVFQNK